MLTGRCAYSVWFFLLLGAEAIRQNKITPHLAIGGQSIMPTWAVPLAIAVISLLLMPGSSFLGHLSGLVVGYMCMYLLSSDTFP